MPYIKGNSGHTVEVDEGVLAGLLRDPDITEVDAKGKPLKSATSKVTKVVDGFARPTGALAPFDTVTQPPVVESDDKGQPTEVVTPPAAAKTATKAAAAADADK